MRLREAGIWNVYVMDWGRGIVDAVGSPLVGAIQENKVRMSNYDWFDRCTHSVAVSSRSWYASVGNGFVTAVCG